MQTWQGPKKNTEILLAVNKQDSEKGNNLKATKTTQLTRKQVGEVLQRVAGKPADNFARIAGQPANSFVIVVNVGPNPLEDEQLEFSAFFKP